MYIHSNIIYNSKHFEDNTMQAPVKYLNKILYLKILSTSVIWKTIEVTFVNLILEFDKLLNISGPLNR